MKLILNGGGDGKAAVSARQLLNRVIDHHKKIPVYPVRVAGSYLSGLPGIFDR